MEKKGNISGYSQHSPPSLNYIADSLDRIRCRSSVQSSSEYLGGGRVTKPDDWVERQGWTVSALESSGTSVVSESNDWPSKVGNWSKSTPLSTGQCQPCVLPNIPHRFLASTIHSKVSIPMLCAVAKSQWISSWVVVQSNMFWEKFSICRICGKTILISQRQAGFNWEGRASNRFRVGSAASWMEWERSLRTCQFLSARSKLSEWKL